MAGNKKISQLTPITGADLQVGDQFAAARAAGDLNFSVTRAEMFRDVPAFSADTIQVTNIQAKDGTVSASIANSTGAFTITDVDITGGTITGATVDGRNVGDDGAKLDGIEENADVTDTANVTSAGALMDSELTDIAAVKALDQGVSTSDSPTFDGLTNTGTFTVDLSSVSSTGDLSVANGGTGASTAEDARTNLDVDQAGTALALAIALG